MREAERRIQPSNILTSLGKLEPFEKIRLPGLQNMALFSQDNQCVCVYVRVCVCVSGLWGGPYTDLNKLVVNCQFPRGVAGSLRAVVSWKPNPTLVDAVRPRWSTREGLRERVGATRRQPGGSN